MLGRGEQLKPLPGKRKPGKTSLEMPKTMFALPACTDPGDSAPTSSQTPQDPIPCSFLPSGARCGLEEAGDGR